MWGPCKANARTNATATNGVASRASATARRQGSASVTGTRLPGMRIGGNRGGGTVGAPTGTTTAYPSLSMLVRVDACPGWLELRLVGTPEDDPLAVGRRVAAANTDPGLSGAVGGDVARRRLGL